MSMRTSAPSKSGPIGKDQWPLGHVDVRAVTVTTMNKSGTIYGRTTVMVSRGPADQGSTTIGIGVISKFR